MNSLPWLGLVDAVRRVCDALQVSAGKACAMLVSACASEVRSRKRPWTDDEAPPAPIYDHWGMPISPLEWHGAAIEFEHGWLVAAGEGL